MKPPDPERYDMQRYWSEVHRLDADGSVDEMSLVMHHDLPLYYNVLYDGLEQREYDRAWQRAGIPECGACVEIGPGRGRFTTRLLRRGLEVFGLDISPEAVLRLRERFPHERFEVGSASRIPLPDASVDFVSSVVVLLHLPPDEKAAAIGEIARVLRPGGFALLIESTHIADRAPHVFPLSTLAWTEQFERVGLSCVYYRGQEYVPLLRLAEELHRSAVARRGRPSHPLGVALRAADRLARARPSRRVLVAVSGILEPLARRLCSSSFARHGVFVFRKPGQAHIAPTEKR